MICFKYPKDVEAELKRIDDKIDQIYLDAFSPETIEKESEYFGFFGDGLYELESKKRRLYARIEPFEKLKAEIVKHSVPIMIVSGEDAEKLNEYTNHEERGTSMIDVDKINELTDNLRSAIDGALSNVPLDDDDIDPKEALEEIKRRDERRTLDEAVIRWNEQLM